MGSQDNQARTTFEDLSRQQLEIYATELREQFREANRLRAELEQTNEDLGQRVRELLALNNLFRQRVSQHDEVTQGVGRIIAGLQELAGQAEELVDRTRV